ncbi:MAG: cytochrome C [Bradyrhizobium sp.]
MQSVCSRLLRALGSRKVFCGIALTVVSSGLLTIGFSEPAQALPSFARQTGQPCGTCHTDFPALTPYGRRFKLLGYTAGGGEFRTTPFSSDTGINARAELDRLRGYTKTLDAPASDNNKIYVPPVSMMAVVGFTHTQADVPGQDPYKPNDNTVLTPFSAFYGGAITDHIGAFAQVTYSAPDPLSALTGLPVDQFKHTWSWDNVDVRYANTGHIGPVDVVYGITANNNPTVQDLWNTTPAWAFPYATSSLASTPAASTAIEGTFAARVGGVGVYAMFNDLLYLELSGYKTLGFRAQNSLGINPFDGPGPIGGVAPYWRIALEPHYGKHSLMVGAFGTQINVHPWIDPTFALGTTAAFAQSDKFTDVGFDTQYQYQGDNYWLTLRASYIHEFQRLNASFNGFSSTPSTNPTNTINSLHLQGSFAYGSDNRVVFTGQYFDISGTADAGLYSTDPITGNALTPNSNGWIAELAYIPFSASKSMGWPWFNARIGLQYTYYNKFNGTTVGAHDNNTLFLHAWFAM